MVVDDRRRQQASKISRTVQREYWPPTLLIRNGSDQDISAVTAEVRVTDDPTRRMTVDDRLKTLPPGEQRMQRAIDAIAPDFTPHVSIDVSFTDEAGRRWIRDSNGNLRPHPPLIADVLHKDSRTWWRRAWRWIGR